jgi:hypothetical protein
MQPGPDRLVCKLTMYTPGTPIQCVRVKRPPPASRTDASMLHLAAHGNCITSSWNGCSFPNLKTMQYSNNSHSSYTSGWQQALAIKPAKPHTTCRHALANWWEQQHAAALADHKNGASASALGKCPSLPDTMQTPKHDPKAKRGGQFITTTPGHNQACWGPCMHTSNHQREWVAMRNEQCSNACARYMECFQLPVPYIHSSSAT